VSGDCHRGLLGQSPSRGLRSTGARRHLLVHVVAVLLTLLGSWQATTFPSTSANTGCPASDDAFGEQSSAGTCAVDSDTTWGNGTYTIAGDVTVSNGATLTLWNMTIRIEAVFDQQHRISLEGGRLVVRGGTLTSGAGGYTWRLETNFDNRARVDFHDVNISKAGGNGRAGFLVRAGSGHLFQNLRVTDSGIGLPYPLGVITIDGLDVTGLLVDNSSFTNTGRVYSVVSSAADAKFVFRDNTVSDYDPTSSGPVISASSTDILNNFVHAGTNTAIELWGGGPGRPGENDHSVSFNQIITTGRAIHAVGPLGYDVTWNHVIGGQVVLAGSGFLFAYNNVSGTDARASPGHIVEIGSNSTVSFNTLWNVALTVSSGILVSNYGNVRIHGNRELLRCFGNNCMGIEVINVQEEQRPVYPGFPTVEVSWNTITWTELSPDAVTIMLDNEFSRRLYLHNNTEYVTAPGGRATSSIHGGGVLDSVYENNTVYGPTSYCIYNYIYEGANNLFQYNRCDDAYYGGIFQTGGNTYRHNTFTNLSYSGLFICPNAPCAGSSANTADNAWYNNTFRFRDGLYLTRMQRSNAFDNIFIGHGASLWTEGASGPFHPIYGGWLFFADADLERLEFRNRLDGSRWVEMTVAGRTYWDREPLFGATDEAGVVVSGRIDRLGSVDGRTVLWNLNPRGTTRLEVTGAEVLTFNLVAFEANHTYNVTLFDYASSQSENRSVATNQVGAASFAVDFGPQTTQREVTISNGVTTDRELPGRIQDLRAVETTENSVTLEWTAPGDDGASGRATAYDLRFSTFGPITDASFFSASSVATSAPQPSGATERVVVGGLSPDTQHWFAVRAADEVPNWAPISNVVDVTTPATPPPPDMTPPTVVSIEYDSSRYRIVLVFSEAMNQSSVEAALTITPGVPHISEWMSASQLRLWLLSKPTPEVNHVLRISTLAEDRSGNHLAEDFRFSFAGPPPPAPNGWNEFVVLGAVILMSVATALCLILYSRSRRRMKAMRAAVGGFAERLSQHPTKDLSPPRGPESARRGP